MASSQSDLDFAREVIETEIRALRSLIDRLGESFHEAVECLLNCPGRVVVTGMGKAGIIGQKISATLASTGTPSHWMHPVEAVHGDLGRIVGDDVVLALSNSGETDVVKVLSAVKRIGAKIIAITGRGKSTLARHADVVLDIGPIEEACPLGLAPSASTTAMLALGDALALATAEHRKFDKDQYAQFHPGGELGLKLLKVEEVMRPPEACACVKPDTTLATALAHAPKRAGAVCVVDDSAKLVGIFTDGDLRRQLRDGTEFLNRPVSEVMTANPKSVPLGSLVQEAAKTLEDYQIDEIPVVDDAGKLCGLVDVQDLLAARLIAP